MQTPSWGRAVHRTPLSAVLPRMQFCRRYTAPVTGAEFPYWAARWPCPNDEIPRLCPLDSTYAFYIFTYWAIDSSRAQRMDLLSMEALLTLLTLPWKLALLAWLHCVCT